MINVHDQTITNPRKEKNWLASIYVRDGGYCYHCKSFLHADICLHYYGILQVTQGSKGQFNI